mmetsp:Transcript_39350/g.73061  ORF Transcript_39350/g.73061 Transcript_39350/m.73061 type:complete len:82 (+) Transcript_39350:99-344(+)
MYFLALDDFANKSGRVCLVGDAHTDNDDGDDEDDHNADDFVYDQDDNRGARKNCIWCCQLPLWSVFQCRRYVVCRQRFLYR